MARLLKYRVQSYEKFASWKKRALPYLKKEEGRNNIFWQIIRNKEKTANEGWMGNLYSNGLISLSALHTPSNFLLLSHGSVSAVEALAKYSIKKQWRIDGVSGPQSLVEDYFKCIQKWGNKSKVETKRNFKIFETSLFKKNSNFKNHKLAEVKAIDWQRARLWAQQFAMEADPPMNSSAIIQMAKQMHSSDNLFMLYDSHNFPCAMAGFGRFTDHYCVINLVYVPRDMRGLGIGKELIIRMTSCARKLGYKECLLFSEWMGSKNLYKDMGCKILGRYAEYDLS